MAPIAVRLFRIGGLGAQTLGRGAPTVVRVAPTAVRLFRIGGLGAQTLGRGAPTVVRVAPIAVRLFRIGGLGAQTLGPAAQTVVRVAPTAGLLVPTVGLLPQMAGRVVRTAGRRTRAVRVARTVLVRARPALVGRGIGNPGLTRAGCRHQDAAVSVRPVTRDGEQPSRAGRLPLPEAPQLSC